MPFLVLLQFRKLPEGFRKAYRKRTWELLFYVGPGRFPEGFRKLTGRKTIIRFLKKINVRRLIWVNLPAMGPRQAKLMILVVPSETYNFLVTFLHETDRFLLWRPRDQIQRCGDLDKPTPSTVL